MEEALATGQLARQLALLQEDRRWGRRMDISSLAPKEKSESEIHENIMRKSEEATSIVRKDM